MGPWFVRVIPTVFMIIFSIVPIVIGGIALYFIIKHAVKSALKEHEQDMHK